MLFILIGESLYNPCPSLKGEIKLLTPLNNFMGVAELVIIIIFYLIFTYFDCFDCLNTFEALFKFTNSKFGIATL